MENYNTAENNHIEDSVESSKNVLYYSILLMILTECRYICCS